MHVQIVMDHTGDIRHHFDPNDELANVESRKRFQKLTDAGYTAAKRTGKGTSELIREFDPTARERCSCPGSSADESFRFLRSAGCGAFGRDAGAGARSRAPSIASAGGAKKHCPSSIVADPCSSTSGIPRGIRSDWWRHWHALPHHLRHRDERPSTRSRRQAICAMVLPTRRQTCRR
jgi:hypothetical protein